MGQTLDRVESGPRSLPLNITTQRSRFRGALLGLILVPTAASLISNTDSAATDFTTKMNAAKMNAAVLHSLEQIKLFLSSTSTASGAVASQTAHVKTWLDTLPILLRYPHRANNHCLWQADAATTAQYWLLSDILGAAMSGQPLNKTWLTHQAHRAAQSTDSAPATCHYQWLWKTLVNRLLAEQLPAQKTARHQTTVPLVTGSLSPDEIAHHSAMVTGVACGLAFISEDQAGANGGNYGLSISIAARTIATAQNTAQDTAHWEAPLVAGLVSGAIVGHSDLPILWQQVANSRASEGLFLADALFCQWAGLMSRPD